jgi:U32 family peptidase
MQNIKHKKPELLAPAGSSEAFHAAIEAGANAVYLGVGELNARLRAKNFTTQTLSYLIGYAHQKNIKVYITLNTIVKQGELPGLFDLLYQLEQLRVDAVIVQDLGLAYIVRTYFPKLPFHASTQMVIHNQVGATGAKNIGFSRVILSRETTMDEIQQIKETTDVELEVFVHGALCYSISGLCLASSYIGGWSGNRGRCTQVCRRKFSGNYDNGFYFSPKDFSAADYIENFSQLGITSLKIEGRMKSAEYVYSAVKSYRTLLDDYNQLPKIKEDLNNDMGREKTPFLLESVTQKNIIVSNRPSGTGTLLGRVNQVKKDQIFLPITADLDTGDKIRVHNQKGAEGVSLSIVSCQVQGKQQIISLKTDHPVKPGDQVFLTSRKKGKHKDWSKIKLDVKPVRFQKKYTKAGAITAKIKRSLPAPSKQVSTLFYRINQLEWLNILKTIKFDYLIYTGGKDEFDQLLESRKQLQYWKPRLIIELPPFIPNGDLLYYEKMIEKFHQIGIQHWMASHFSHKSLFPKGDQVFINSTVWASNYATQKQLFDLDYSGFCYSLEDDILNLKIIPHPQGILTMFGQIPLFISRVKPDIKAGESISDSKDYEFVLKEKGELYYLLGEKPLCLFHRQDKMESLGISNHLIDLSFYQPSRKFFKAITFNYQNKQKAPDSILFNHKAGFK